MIRLPFEVNQLEPFQSREALFYHYEKHHKAYETKVLEYLSKQDHKPETLEELLHTTEGKEIHNHVAQLWNHNFFWNCLTPESPGEPVGELSRHVFDQFKSYENFKKEFEDKAMKHFGSGWVWLLRDDSNELHIKTTHDAENPLVAGLTPLVTCDLWEHAYYVDYKHNRELYLHRFWSYVNWPYAEQIFKQRLKVY
jgi:Fe-Mn family superoxide dismutase